MNNMPNLKYYSFAHCYLSPLHAAIQTTHAVANLFVSPTPEFLNTAHLWVQQGSTLVILNGGSSKRLSVIEELAREQSAYPYTYFFESSMDGMLTTVGIILPEKIWFTAERIRHKEINLEEFSTTKTLSLPGGIEYKFTENEYQWVMLLVEARLFV